MKVRELIELLLKCDSEAEAMVSDYSNFNNEVQDGPAQCWSVVTRIDTGFSEDPGLMSWDMALNKSPSGYTERTAVWIVGFAEDDVDKPLIVSGQ